ncbi:hypothetical protein DIPPA_25255 [Diplonema papillatum]|nr:hypothetical protein DIPPA_25255 [Diplonema papillatum]
MGWSWAPAIAQRIATVLAHQVQGFAWVDNFFFGAETEEACWAKARAFRALIEKARLEVKEDLVPTQRLKALGMEFDLTEGSVRMDPAWVKTLDLSWFERGPRITARTVFGWLGRIAWRCFAMKRRLCARQGLMDVARRLAGRIGVRYELWDNCVELSLKEIGELEREVLEIRANNWFRPVRPCREWIVGWSDASDDMWAVALEVGPGVVKAGFFHHLEGIFSKELLAVVVRELLQISQRLCC